MAQKCLRCNCGCLRSGRAPSENESPHNDLARALSVATPDAWERAAAERCRDEDWSESWENRMYSMKKLANVWIWKNLLIHITELYQWSRLLSVVDINWNDDSSKLKYTCVKIYESPAWPSHFLPMFARTSPWAAQHCSSFPAPSYFDIDQ